MTTYPIRARIRAESETTRVDVMDDIGADPWFGGGIAASDFAGQLAGVRGPLDVHISSQGGVVSDGLAIYNALLQHPGDVTTFVDGYAASIASVIAQAGKRRVMAPASAMMIHDPWGAVEGNQADALRLAAALGTNADVIAGAYAAGGTVDQWRQAMQAEKWYTPEEAVSAGLADEVAGTSAQLPRGLDLDALAARAPERIMARLRAAAPAAPDDGDGQECKTCGGSGRLKHPGTGKNGMKCPGCGGTGTYDPDTASGDDDGQGDGQGDGDNEGMQDRLRNAAGKPYEPQPYKRTPDENVQCPACEKFGDDDSRYCGQCGTQLTGRTDVKEAALAPASNSADDDRLWAVYRQAVRDAGKVDNSPWDGSKAMAAGVDADDPAAFYEGICAGKKDGNPRNQDSWALPYKYAPGDPPNAAGVKNALARLPQTQGLTNEAEAKKTLQAAMKQVNPDWEPEDSGGKNISGADALEQVRSALKGARA